MRSLAAPRSRNHFPPMTKTSDDSILGLVPGTGSAWRASLGCRFPFLLRARIASIRSTQAACASPHRNPGLLSLELLCYAVTFPDENVGQVRMTNWATVRDRIRELRGALYAYAAALDSGEMSVLVEILGVKTQGAAGPPQIQQMRTQIARLWGEVREDIASLGVPLYWSANGRSFATFDIIATPPDPRAPSVLRDSIRFGIGALDLADGVVARRLSEATSPPPAKESAGRSSEASKRVFVVHGHDVALRESIVNLVQRLGLRAVVLQDTPNLGRTIVEKLEREGDVAFAVVLLTPDDVGGPAPKTPDAQPTLTSRARQNVILELGFFMGALGRSRVAVLHVGSLELPSDVYGVAYIPADRDWKLRLANELKAAGLPVDLNRAAD